MRRCAAGLETDEVGVRKTRASRAESTADLPNVIIFDRRRRLRPSIRRDRAAALVVTAITQSQHELIAAGGCPFVARVNRLPQAAGMRRGSIDRQR